MNVTAKVIRTAMYAFVYTHALVQGKHAAKLRQNKHTLSSVHIPINICNHHQHTHAHTHSAHNTLINSLANIYHGGCTSQVGRRRCPTWTPCWPWEIYRGQAPASGKYVAIERKNDVLSKIDCLILNGLSIL